MQDRLELVLPHDPFALPIQRNAHKTPAVLHWTCWQRQGRGCFSKGQNNADTRDGTNILVLTPKC
jgi:hypothetical protein